MRLREAVRFSDVVDRLLTTLLKRFCTAPQVARAVFTLLIWVSMLAIAAVAAPTLDTLPDTAADTPAKTPRGIVEKLHRETLKALQEPKVKNKLVTLGIDPMVMTPTEFDAHVEKEIAVNAALVNAIGLKPQ